MPVTNTLAYFVGKCLKKKTGFFTKLKPGMLEGRFQVTIIKFPYHYLKKYKMPQFKYGRLRASEEVIIRVTRFTKNDEITLKSVFKVVEKGMLVDCFARQRFWQVY